jgi:uncharacterized lipoprotein YehR (DUF1307 family)
MKQILLMISVVALVGCGESEEGKAAKAKAVAEAKVVAEAKAFAETKAKAEAGGVDAQFYLPLSLRARWWV